MVVERTKKKAKPDLRKKRLRSVRGQREESDAWHDASSSQRAPGAPNDNASRKGSAETPGPVGSTQKKERRGFQPKEKRKKERV